MSPIHVTTQFVTDFNSNEAKKENKIQNKIQNGWLKKAEFFNSVNSQYFFVKISGIGPWVSRINHGLLNRWTVH